MAQSTEAKGTASAKSAGTTLVIPDVAMIGGDSLVVAVAFNSNESGNPTVKLGKRRLTAIDAVNLSSTWRLRIYQSIINNTRTKDVNIEWPASVTARVATARSLHSAGRSFAAGINTATQLANTVSTTGGTRTTPASPCIHMGFHMTNGPAGDAIGDSSTGHLLGQRVGTTGGAATSNITLQETYQLVTLPSQDIRSRLRNLTSRDHGGIMVPFYPRQILTITRMEQLHRVQNHLPNWIWVEVEDESGRGFEFPIDPDIFDGWSDQAVADYVAKIASNWVNRNVDNNLEYEADVARDARMATFINDLVEI